MCEIWKDIQGYEGLYQVSNKGNVKSFREGTKNGKAKEYILKSSYNEHGYCVVTLYRSPKDRRKFLVHRLVATAFLENDHQFPCINHKNEVKDDNRVENLEWCTYEYNNAYGTARIRANQKIQKPIAQYTLEGFWIASYCSSETASRLLGFSDTSIRECCNGKNPYAHGYIWKYIHSVASLLQ